MAQAGVDHVAQASHDLETIASPTGEGMTNPVSFSRIRRCTLKDAFRIV
jgi:hypothetical protein